MESSNWFESLRHRIAAAWGVLTGRAYACYEPPSMETTLDAAYLRGAGGVFLGEFEAYWNDRKFVPHPDAPAFSYLRNARDEFAAALAR